MLALDIKTCCTVLAYELAFNNPIAPLPIYDVGNDTNAKSEPIPSFDQRPEHNPVGV